VAERRHLTSAGILAHTRNDSGDPLVFLAHLGGPFWAHRDSGAWGIPKGEFDEGSEDPLVAARREFAEEIGVPAPDGEVTDLGTHVQPGGKRVRTFALEVASPESLTFVSSNLFDLEWPRGSGVIRQFPETDDAAWFDLTTARVKLLSGQVPILDTFAQAVARVV
jgi:predicted NUDIX family NTP pyrophosphohydrolase